MDRQFFLDRSRWELDRKDKITAAGISGAVALYWFVHAYRGSTYVYLPLLTELLEARDSWREFYEAAHQAGADQCKHPAPVLTLTCRDHAWKALMHE